MAVPKRKTSPSRRNMRRSHHGVALPVFQECNNCGRPRQSHRACGFCGHYRGRQVLIKKAAKPGHGEEGHVHDEHCGHDHH